VWRVSWHDSFICVTWLMRDMTHSYAWHDSCVTWLIHMCDMTRDMTHSYAWHDSYVTWLIHMHDMTHAWHDSFICVTWLVTWLVAWLIQDLPLKEEISLQIFGSADIPVFFIDFLSAGDSVYSREFFLKISGLPWKRVWYVWGLPWKLVWKFGSRNYIKSNLLRLWYMYVTWLVHDLYVCRDP